MKRVFTGTCLAALCAVTLAAQTPAGQPPASPSQDTMKTITATGCLRAGEQPDTFVLSNVKGADKAKTGATGTTGTAASSTAPAIPSTLRLVGAPAGVQLTEHIGHTVEVTGTLNDKDKGPAATAGTAASGTGAASKGRADKPEATLNVRTVKVVSTSCEPN